MMVNGELARSVGHIHKDRWETPDDVFNTLNNEFNFTLDPCCEDHTAKCNNYFTEVENGLIQDWSGHTVFVNPPYSRGNIDMWMKKCYEEAQKRTVIVALIPVSTSSGWFHKYVWEKATEIRFYKGRLRFKGAPYNAPFSSMLAIYNSITLPC